MRGNGLRSIVLSLVVLLFACSGGSSGNPFDAGAGRRYDITFEVKDVNERPISNARVQIRSGTTQLQALTDGAGEVTFTRLTAEQIVVDITADDFEPLTDQVVDPAEVGRGMGFTLAAEGAWAVGRPLILGTRVLEREDDGRAMTVLLDIAVIGGNSAPIRNLTGADFSWRGYECWAPSYCASDAEDNFAGHGGAFSVEGIPQLRAFQEGGVRHPYIAGIAVERYDQYNEQEQIAALRRYFADLGGNDKAALFDYQHDGSGVVLTTRGEFTNAGEILAAAADDLAQPAGATPPVAQVLTPLLSAVAAEEGFGLPGTLRHAVLLANRAELFLDEIRSVARTAVDAGVRIDAVEAFNNGLSRLAMRTGGASVQVSDRRQLPMVLGAMDALMAGTLPYYQLELRLVGAADQTFVPGGNASFALEVAIPADIPVRPAVVICDVAIPL